MIRFYEHRSMITSGSACSVPTVYCMYACTYVHTCILWKAVDAIIRTRKVGHSLYVLTANKAHVLLVCIIASTAFHTPSSCRCCVWHEYVRIEYSASTNFTGSWFALVGSSLTTSSLLSPFTHSTNNDAQRGAALINELSTTNHEEIL